MIRDDHGTVRPASRILLGQDCLIMAGRIRSGGKFWKLIFDCWKFACLLLFMVIEYKPVHMLIHPCNVQFRKKTVQLYYCSNTVQYVQ